MEKYSLEKAQEESREMQDKIISGKAEDYNEAEKLVEKKTSVREIFKSLNIEELQKTSGVTIEQDKEDTYGSEAGFVLKYGAKKLQVSIPEDGGRETFWTRVERIVDKEESLPDETSILYRTAKEIMERFATYKKRVLDMEQKLM